MSKNVMFLNQKSYRDFYDT